MNSPITSKLAKIFLVLVVVAGTHGGVAVLSLVPTIIKESPDIASGGTVAAWAMVATVAIFDLAMIYVAYKLIRWILKGSLPAPGQGLGAFERVALTVGAVGWWFCAIVCLWGLATFVPYLPEYGIEFLAAAPVIGAVFSAGVGWIAFKVLRDSRPPQTGIAARPG